MTEFSDLDMTDILGELDTVDIKKRELVDVMVFNASNNIKYSSFYICPYCDDFKMVGTAIHKLKGNFSFCDCKYRGLTLDVPDEIIYDVGVNHNDTDIISSNELSTVELSVENLIILINEFKTQNLELDNVVTVNV